MQSELSVRDYLETLTRRWRWVLGSLTLCIIVAIVYSISRTPLYRSSVNILINQASTADIFDPSGTAASRAERLVENEALFLRSDVVRSAAVELLGFEAKVSVTARPSADLLVVSVESPSPRRAQVAAQTFAETYIAQRRLLSINDYRETGDVLTARIGELDAELDSLGADDTVDRVRLERLRLDFADALDQLSISAKLAETAGASIIDPAREPVSPFSPRVARNVMFGAVLGLLAGVGAALLADSLDQSITSVDDLERASDGLPNLAVVPAMAAGASALVSIEDPESMAAEAYRTLRAALQYMAVDHEVSVIQITSARPSEGKSTTAANLAIVLAKAGRRVVLVDGDLRKPSIHTLFDVEQEPGLTSVIIGESKVATAGKVIVKDNGMLAVLPSGPMPPGPSELLGSKRAQKVFQNLRELADFVVVDSPPVLPVADALVLSRYVDATLLVANGTKTNAPDFAHAVEQLQQVNAPLVGTILNQVSHRRFGYGYGYNYGYGHGRESYGYTKSSPEAPTNLKKFTARLFGKTAPASPVPTNLAWLEDSQIPKFEPAISHSRTVDTDAWNEDDITVTTGR